MCGWMEGRTVILKLKEAFMDDLKMQVFRIDAESPRHATSYSASVGGPRATPVYVG